MNRTSIVGFLTVFISGAALGAVSLWFLGAGRGSVGSTSESSAEPAKSVSARRVSISPEKLKVIQIETALLEPTKVRQQMQVPATITLNVDRRATVSPRVPGIVRQVDVVLGQKVKAGQRLAMIESPDVGTARLLVRSHRFDLQVSKRDAEWRALITKNVELLMTDLATKPEAKTLEIKYANKPLGHDRGMLLSSYAKYELTRHEELKQLELFKKNLIGEHLIHQSQHGREGAQAEFESAMEQTRFDVLQEKRISDQKVQQAEVDLIDAVQRLRLLGVPGDDPSLDLDLNSSEIVSADWTRSIVMEDVAAYPIVAAFDGTITSRTVVPSQKVDMGAPLFTLADLSTVRVSAQIAEKDFSSLADLKLGDVIDVIAPGTTNKVVHGNIIYIGAEVDPQTRTVPVIAETPNATGQLRPGQFCRVNLERAEQDGVLAVPGSAVVEWNGKSGVFVALKDGKSFDFQPVILDQQPVDDKHMVVVRQGLSAGQTVVTGGAFMLKSELILSLEPEEE
ncbi:MAG: efflux RND transporter periplasmic adaptor subunit [Planctomycetota bacterium]|nr:efflux RND transporter periplasmic adaptor subunit [Planctomycetota bacterium]